MALGSTSSPFQSKRTFAAAESEFASEISLNNVRRALSKSVKDEASRAREGVPRLFTEVNGQPSKMRMRKMLEAMAEVVRSQNPLFRKPASLPRKAQKHRYERRKVKEFIHLMEGQNESPC